MRSKLRRYEVLLPARYNDGQSVPDELLGEAVKEIVKQLNTVTYFENSAEGYSAPWRHSLPR